MEPRSTHDTITTRNGAKVKGIWRDTGPTGVLARVRADASAVMRAYRRARRSSLAFGAPRRPSCDDASRANPNDLASALLNGDLDANHHRIVRNSSNLGIPINKGMTFNSTRPRVLYKRKLTVFFITSDE